MHRNQFIALIKYLRYVYLMHNTTITSGACSYVLPPDDPAQADTNPAAHYPHLKSSCKLAYGLGMCVVSAGIATVLAVTVRRDASSGG